MSEVYKPKTTFSKKFFSQCGVIFQLEDKKERNSIVICHWPHCGMNATTARRLAKWLLKRADDLDKRKEK
jgi:hypothetical protein